jgi:hypothetical protein
MMDGWLRRAAFEIRRLMGPVGKKAWLMPCRRLVDEVLMMEPFCLLLDGKTMSYEEVTYMVASTSKIGWQGRLRMWGTTHESLDCWSIDCIFPLASAVGGFCRSRRRRRLAPGRKYCNYRTPADRYDNGRYYEVEQDIAISRPRNVGIGG